MTDLRFHIIGAFDRFNYGDVLFAHLSQHLLQSEIGATDLRFYGLRSSNLEPWGGVRTQPLRALFHSGRGPAGH